MEIGDRVTWTHCSTRGRTCNMRLREGVVEELDGDMAIIRRPNGRRESVKVVRLRLLGQRSQITEFVEAIFGRNLP